MKNHLDRLRGNYKNTTMLPPRMSKIVDCMYMMAEVIYQNAMDDFHLCTVAYNLVRALHMDESESTVYRFYRMLQKIIYNKYTPFCLPMGVRETLDENYITERLFINMFDQTNPLISVSSFFKNIESVKSTLRTFHRIPPSYLIYCYCRHVGIRIHESADGQRERNLVSETKHYCNDILATFKLNNALQPVFDHDSRTSDGEVDVASDFLLRLKTRCSYIIVKLFALNLIERFSNTFIRPIFHVEDRTKMTVDILMGSHVHRHIGKRVTDDRIGDVYFVVGFELKSAIAVGPSEETSSQQPKAPQTSPTQTTIKYQGNNISTLMTCFINTLLSLKQATSMYCQHIVFEYKTFYVSHKTIADEMRLVLPTIDSFTKYATHACISGENPMYFVTALRDAFTTHDRNQITEYIQLLNQKAEMSP